MHSWIPCPCLLITGPQSKSGPQDFLGGCLPSPEYFLGWPLSCQWPPREPQGLQTFISHPHPGPSSPKGKENTFLCLPHCHPSAQQRLPKSLSCAFVGAGASSWTSEAGGREGDLLPISGSWGLGQPHLDHTKWRYCPQSEQCGSGRTRGSPWLQEGGGLGPGICELVLGAWRQEAQGKLQLGSSSSVLPGPLL